MLFIGLAFLFGFAHWWPLALVGTSAGLFFSSWVIQREIQKRKLTQETLQQNEVKYRHIIDNANSIILEMDTLGNLLFINKFAQEFFGYREDELLGHNIIGTLISPDGPAGLEQTRMLQDIVFHPEDYRHKEREHIRAAERRS